MHNKTVKHWLVPWSTRWGEGTRYLTLGHRMKGKGLASWLTGQRLATQVCLPKSEPQIPAEQGEPFLVVLLPTTHAEFYLHTYTLKNYSYL